MYVPVNSDVKEDWKGWTLILPTVSVGNVGQLAMDIFLNQTEASHVGYLHDDSLLPVLGNHPLIMSGPGKCTLTTSAQAYEDSSRKNIYVQIRSPIVRHMIIDLFHHCFRNMDPSKLPVVPPALIMGKRCQFVERVVRWAQATQFGRILVITSLHSYERIDTQMRGTQLRWLVSPDLQDSVGHELLSACEWIKELERRPPRERLDPYDKHPDVFLPGSGFGKQLYSQCVSAGMPISILLTFCAEGVNSMDAATLAAATHPFVLDTDWSASPPAVRTQPASPLQNVSIPESWGFMFGNTFEQSMFQ